MIVGWLCCLKGATVSLPVVRFGSSRRTSQQTSDAARVNSRAARSFYRAVAIVGLSANYSERPSEDNVRRYVYCGYGAGSVCLTSFGAVAKSISALVMPPPGSAAARSRRPAQALVRSCAGVKGQVSADRSAGLGHAGIGAQVDLLVFHRFPKALDEDVVAPGALAVDADLDAGADQ